MEEMKVGGEKAVDVEAVQPVLVLDTFGNNF